MLWLRDRQVRDGEAGYLVRPVPHHKAWTSRIPAAAILDNDKSRKHETVDKLKFLLSKEINVDGFPICAADQDIKAGRSRPSAGAYEL